jgi:hypothetical protein
MVAFGARLAIADDWLDPVLFARGRLRGSDTGPIAIRIARHDGRAQPRLVVVAPIWG